MRTVGLRAAFSAVILVLLALDVPAVRSDSDDLGGKFTFPNASNSYINPCEANAAVNGTVNFTTFVHANSSGGGKGTVTISVLFTGGGVTDTFGNKFVMHGSATALYDTLSDHYVLPTILDYDDPSNSSLDFFGLTDTTVFVDQKTQKPFAFRNVGGPPVCNKK
jgi:hypothetical protein